MTMFYHNEGKLIIEDNLCSAFIEDAEMDAIKLEFNNDDRVKLNVEKFQYITLTRSNINSLKRLLNQSEKYYESNDLLSDEDI